MLLTTYEAKLIFSRCNNSIDSLSNFFFRPLVYGCSLQDIGGCDIQKQEIREAVELPLTHHELYRQIGIDPPRGVLLYGPPGTGKTMLAKAVAHHTTASFIRVVGSEFVQKYLGEVQKYFILLVSYNFPPLFKNFRSSG